MMEELKIQLADAREQALRMQVAIREVKNMLNTLEAKRYEADTQVTKIEESIKKLILEETNEAG